ncbi:acetylglutamate kinase [Schaalia vaccimaxillae]|uniref:acetylglutamate kinase n=1 Tax=Schaalia vaccimaxillae TaxID=183916 RepID=UPI00047BE40D|nr:acetylglutamate kinase [Schaalia vaccimaxillae]
MNPAHVNSLTPAERAHVLGEALTWMRAFRGDIVVIKYGGHAMTDPDAGAAFASDVQYLRQAGMLPVVVHGGGPQVTRMLARLGIETPFRDGVRVTTPEAMDVVRMVLTGSVQRSLISELNQHDNLAIGISGEDGALFRAQRRRRNDAGQEADFGLVGDICGVDPGAVTDMLAAGRIPVVSSIALDDEDPSAVLNINADAAASALAVALGATKLLMLTDVEGIYSNYPDPDSLIRSATASQLRDLGDAISSGMIPKVQACLDAIDGGVGAVHVVDGRMPHSVLIEIMTDEGTGTMVVPDPEGSSR